MSELMEKLIDDVEETDAQITEEEARFTVDDDRKAEWCIGKIREAQAELAKFMDWYNAQIEREKKRVESRIAFFEDKLKPYFAMVPKKETKTQLSYQLPSAKLVLKRQGPEFVRDDEKLIPWARENAPDFVKTKLSIDWAGMKKTLTVVGDQVADSAGEVVPGITVQDRPDVFKVEVK